MTRTSMFPALLATAAVVMAGCGDDGGSDVAGSGVDRAFVADMVPHHKSAIEMAEIARKRGESPFVKKLADDIIASQSKEVTALQAQDAELAEAGVRKGKLGVPAGMMGMDDDPAALESAEPFDKAFIG